MDILKSAKEFLTGRSSESKDLVTNYTQVSVTVDGINHAADQIETTKGKFVSIINEINKMKGVADYFSATLPAGEYESSFDDLKKHVVGIGTTLKSDADAAKAYAEASIGEKFVATVGMAAAKTGEGFVSAFEDIGDGAFSLGGFFAANIVGIFNKDTKEGIEKFVGNTVKKDISHDIFNYLYYSRDIAKKSAFTEDSGLAGAFNVVGKSAGYLYMGGVLSEVGGKLPLIGKEKFVGKALGKVASSSTWGATAAAGIGGTGSGTESSLIRGNDFNKAFKDGAVQGAVQAGLAFGAGVASEKIQQHKLLKSDDPNDILQAGQNIQGYDDPITRAGRNFGAHPKETVIGAAKNAGKTAANAVTHPVDNILKPVVNAVTHPVNNILKPAAKSVVATSGTVATVATTPGGVTTTAENVFRVSNEMDARKNKNLPPNFDVSQATKDGNISETSNPKVEKNDNSSNNPTPPTPTPPETGDDGSGGGGSHEGSDGSGGESYEPANYVPTTPSETTPTTTTPTTNQDATNSTLDPISSVESSNEEIAKDEVLNPTTSDNSTETTNTSTNTTQADNSSNNTPNTTSAQDTSPQTTTTPTEQPATTASAETFSTPSSTNYTGGSYSEDTGYIPSNEENGLEEMTNTDLETPDDLSLIDDASDSIEDIIQRGRTTKIPTSSVPIQPTVKSTGNGVIPIAAGLSAAAAAGIGAKAYIDHKNNSSYDDIDTEDWSEDDSLLEIDESNENDSEELSKEDEYAYQEETEKYGARSNDELADLQ